MSAHVTIWQSGPDRLRIELRQGETEVVRFVLFAAIIAGALYLLIPEARTSPGPLLALLAVTSVWGGIALTAREIYDFDGVADTIEVVRSSAAGHSRRRFRASEVAVVRLALGGPDDNRRLVELLAPDGSLRLRLPGRLTTLNEADQASAGRAIADQLRVGLR